jgi:hypothetical protein
MLPDVANEIKEREFLGSGAYIAHRTLHDILQGIVLDLGKKAREDRIKHLTL